MISRPANWDTIEESTGEFKTLKPGGYVCIIKKATDVPEKNYFEVEYDVAEGPLKGIALDAYEKFGNWNYKFRVYYTNGAMGFLKHFVSCLEKTNRGYTFDWNVATLAGKGIGLLIGTRQYYGKDGTLKSATDVQDYYTAEEIRAGEFKEPKVKPPRDTPPAASANVFSAPTFEAVGNEDNLPF